MKQPRRRANQPSLPSPCPRALPQALRTALLRLSQTNPLRPRHARIRTVRLIFITLLALVLATIVGLGATWVTATRGTDLGTLTIGSWTARPKTGTAEIDPYSRASIAR